MGTQFFSDGRVTIAPEKNAWIKNSGNPSETEKGAINGAGNLGECILKLYEVCMESFFNQDFVKAAIRRAVCLQECLLTLSFPRSES